MEMRRGALALAVLSQLDSPQYGYSLKKRLVEEGLDIDEGTLYPLLRRLEEQGLLTSDWQIEESRPRRYYRTSPDGRGMRAALAADWAELAQVMDQLLNDQQERSDGMD